MTFNLMFCIVQVPFSTIWYDTIHLVKKWNSFSDTYIYTNRLTIHSWNKLEYCSVPKYTNDILFFTSKLLLVLCTVVWSYTTVWNCRNVQIWDKFVITSSHHHSWPITFVFLFFVQNFSERYGTVYSKICTLNNTGENNW